MTRNATIFPKAKNVLIQQRRGYWHGGSTRRRSTENPGSAARAPGDANPAG